MNLASHLTPHPAVLFASQLHMDEDRLEYLAQITSWYYEDSLSQEEIARRIGKSPSMISRLLQESRDNGILEIRVRFPLKRDAALEDKLCSVFGLQGAWVLARPPDEPAALLNRVGKLGARCLQQHVRDHVRIGIGWGTAVYEVVRAMPAMSVRDATVMQIIGSIGSGDPTVDGTLMARWLAEKLDASTLPLHAPLIVQSALVAHSLRQDPAIAEILRLSNQIDVALVGIGTTDPARSGLRRAGYVSSDDMESIQAAGASGDVLGYHLDVHGRALDVSINERVIGISLEALKRIPTSIVVAAGTVKVAATAAVLSGGYADILVTDALTAQSVLDIKKTTFS